jgi:hypothetical protein
MICLAISPDERSDIRERPVTDKLAWGVDLYVAPVRCEPSDAATTEIRATARDRGFLRMTISTSWSSAVRNVISRSTEKPSSL